MFGLTTKRDLERQLQAQADALRAEFRNAWQDADSGAFSVYGSLPTASGVPVTPDSAKRSAAVYACVTLIAGTVASTPLAVYERTDAGRSRIDRHDYWWFFNESPCADMTAATFWEWILSSLLLRGDGLAEIRRRGPNRTGPVTEIVPLPRDQVIVSRQDDGQLLYSLNDTDAKRRRGFLSADVLHFPGYGFNGLCGESVIKHAARQAIGAALAADEYAGGFFLRGASPSVAIEYPQGVAPKPEQIENLRQQFDERYGGLANSHRPMLLVNGGKLSPVSLTPEDSQLLQTRQWQVIDIARAFGVPPVLIGESEKTSSWGSGVEQILRAFLVFALNPRLKIIEQELNRKLWPSRARYYLEFNRDGWLEGDSRTQAEYLARALGGPGQQGWMTINEVRRLKNLPPDPDGDRLVMSGAANGTSQPA